MARQRMINGIDTEELRRHARPPAIRPVRVDWLGGVQTEIASPIDRRSSLEEALGVLGGNVIADFAEQAALAGVMIDSLGALVECDPAKSTRLEAIRVSLDVESVAPRAALAELQSRVEDQAAVLSVVRSAVPVTMILTVGTSPPTERVDEESL